MQKGFLFDLNKCTGCNACQIACSIENEVEFGLNWRQVNTFNESKHPDIPVFNLSTACNHCLDPPCLTYCPAKTIAKDMETGAVNIDADACIGCKYCSWVCPYDSPVYNETKGIMEKCTFCNHRLEENLDPACVALCPTTALQLADHPNDFLLQKISGFTRSEIKPAIQFIDLRADQQLPEICDLPFDDKMVRLFREALSNKILKEKIRYLPEWPLILFSLLVAFLTGSYSSTLLAPPLFSGSVFPILGMIGLVISTMHLGKKLRAPQAIFNFKYSWLSREIVFFSTFLSLLTVQILIFPGERWMIALAVIFGFLALFSFDRVYSVVALETKFKYHSASVLLTGLFFASLFSGFGFGIVIFGGIKLVLYLKQFLSRLRNSKALSLIIGITRLGLGFMLPVIIWYWEIVTFWPIVFILITMAELIDRCQFYNQLKVITPAKQMMLDLEELLTTKDTKFTEKY
jgi:DMSO reductase iron-sulfur subunit